ncbi:ABC transporter permease [Methylobacterium nodulans]|uniref:Binding-protein-dependent transport systems inner membrane component n=1 Tax=Methylobacterium nodulans (strain LMG 21967 / CNCM I-2342 / ORS 2060) TaxID=460265 RepID=B8IW05_METNO|nr:ABC transporter permease [Methylobacterium nodulans]ACL62595.1 binding-protein-dependent transport systems inner membrane component [Methylobacterium nodulans ORS 2060]
MQPLIKAQAWRRRLSSLLALLPALTFLILFFAVPLAENAVRSVAVPTAEGTRISGEYYARLFTDPYYLGILAQTVWVSFEATLICVVIGFPIAYYLVRHGGRWTSLLIFLLVAPLLTSIIMRTFGWSVILARNGVLNVVLLDLGLIERPLRLLQGPASVIIGLVHVLVPFMVISIAAVLRGIDRQLEEGAQILGAGRLRTFWEVTLPLSLDGIATGSIVVFMLANGSFLTMLLLGGGSVVTLPLLIYQQFLLVQNLGFASAMGNVLLALAVASLFLQLRLLRRRGTRA